ncbi:MAG: class I SAM-dependent methyltransferase [Corynebacterium sp.]|nr:class I SAM-dependent methyltransferase [Corynebacterium sp.]
MTELHTSDSFNTELASFILSAAPADPARDRARADAEEFGLTTPDEATGELITLLASLVATEANAAAIAVTPAAGLVGLYLFRGLGDQGHVTCIDPESEHQAQARAVFHTAGFSKFRFLPSRPLDVMERLADESYRMIVGDVDPAELPAFLDASWPLLQTGGLVVLLNSLPFVVASDDTDNTPLHAAQAADSALAERTDAAVVRLPLGAAGMTIIRKVLPAAAG